jgi:hypothetical protein
MLPENPTTKSARSIRSAPFLSLFMTLKIKGAPFITDLSGKTRVIVIARRTKANLLGVS